MDKGILGAKTIKQAARLMKANVFTAPELIEATFENMDKLQHLNAYISVRDKEEAIKEAEEAQKRIERSKWECPVAKKFCLDIPLSRLDGIPIAIKVSTQTFLI